jgi:hypothetical protein
MAGAHRVPAPLDRIDFKDSLRALDWIVATRSLKLSFQTIDVRRIDRPVSKHDVGSECKCTL